MKIASKQVVILACAVPFPPTETSTPHKHMQTHIAPPLPTTEGYPRGIPLWMNSGVVAQPTPDAPRKKGNITSSHLPFIGTAVTSPDLA